MRASISPSRAPGAWRRELARRIRSREARVGVVGLGYAGLPLLLQVAGAGFPVIGVDTDGRRVAGIRAGRSYLSDVPDRLLRDIRGAVSARYRGLGDADVAVVCVPTPLTDHEPDLTHIRAAGRSLAGSLREGMLVILESTTYPGTTEEIFRPILEASGLVAGRDFALAYSPERIDPGRPLEHLAKTPKVVGGVTSACTSLAAAFYRAFVHEVHPVPSPREAEMAKLIENTFRHVNIALVNELAILSRDLNVDIWEAVRAAATKPFGFMPFWPGPGVGGHCIAIDPSYLSWRVGQRVGHRVTFVEHAQEVHARMPSYVARRVGEALNDRGKALRGSRILGLGVAYKPDVNDCRESPAVAVIDVLGRSGARVAYHDPHVPSVAIGGRVLRSRALSPTLLAAQDCVVVLTAHSAIDFLEVVHRAPLVFDARGVTRGLRGRNIVRL